MKESKSRAVAAAIASFRGRFRFLSNFYFAEVCFEGVCYPSLEHAFQAAKSLLAADREWVRAAATPAVAKRRGGPRGEDGRRLCLRSDWEQVKVDVMRELLAVKFEVGSPLAAKLIATGDRELVEGNTWGDVFWGAGDGRGENWLGRLLMERRSALRLDD